MDTLSVITLIVIALVILAVIIAFRKRISLTLKGLGFDLGVEAENYKPESTPAKPAQPAPPPAAPAQPAGVRAEGLEAAEDIYIEEGRTADSTGVGIEAKELKAKKGSILIGKGESGDPKANPPA
jgi:hypothetical protein